MAHNPATAKIAGGTVLGAALALLFACQTGLPPEAVVQPPTVESTGNPPLIPHDVDDAEGGSVCLECHKTGSNGAPKYPAWHATLSDCKQCHVPAEGKAEPFKPAS